MRYKNEFITALLKEIELFPTYTINTKITDQKALTEKEIIETIYFGGGTPSLLTAEEIKNILDRLATIFTIDPTAEITFEANPDDISDENLAAWKNAGINRLSIGVQSFFEEDLQWMNRAHGARQAVDSLQSAVREFSNISIDLIYGTPQLTNEKWKQNVDRAIAFNIPHLSCYALTVEPKTPLDKMIRQHKSPAIDPGKQSDQFMLLMKWLEEAGYEHYEISNFAKPGFRSRHNSSYWQGKNYYGFGPSAHSFNGSTRWWNASNNNLYIESLNKSIIPFEKEELTAVQQINEYIMISLRTTEGLDLSSRQLAVDSSQFTVHSWQSAVRSQSAVGSQQLAVEQLLDKSRKYIENGLMIRKGDFLILTKEGKLLADGIAADLFF